MLKIYLKSGIDARSRKAVFYTLTKQITKFPEYMPGTLKVEPYRFSKSVRFQTRTICNNHEVGRIYK